MDIDKFIFLYENTYDSLTASRKDGLLFIINKLIADTNITDSRWIPYMLATVKHECANTWQPIEEYGKGKGKKYGNPDDTTKKVYYGRGYVQLTWKDNYQVMSKVTGVDLVNNPEYALDPEVSYQILSHGMRKGMFTGAKLATYIHDDVCDYLHCRKIINGMDCAEKIEKYADTLRDILDKCKGD